ncbi:MAG: hypothetical protein GX225_03445 [Clostridiales bacterium]|nr:hypothetical protein [Clostridiales bacterium]
MNFLSNGNSRNEATPQDKAKKAGLWNIISGATASVFLITQNKIIDVDALIEKFGDTPLNIYMIFMLFTVIAGVTAVVINFKGFQREKQVWYMIGIAIAGINATLLFVAAVVTIFAPLGVIIGIYLMVTAGKMKEEKVDEDYEFGGISEGLSNSTSLSSHMNTLNEDESKTGTEVETEDEVETLIEDEILSEEESGFEAESDTNEES